MRAIRPQFDQSHRCCRPSADTHRPEWTASTRSLHAPHSNPCRRTAVEVRRFWPSVAAVAVVQCRVADVLVTNAVSSTPVPPMRAAGAFRLGAAGIQRVAEEDAVAQPRPPVQASVVAARRPGATRQTTTIARPGATGAPLRRRGRPIRRPARVGNPRGAAATPRGVMRRLPRGPPVASRGSVASPLSLIPAEAGWA